MTTFDVTSGVTSSGITLNYADSLVVFSAGTAISTTVNSGGTEIVYYGGTASGTTVNSGGYEQVSSGGTVIGTTVNSGGRGIVYANGTVIGTAVNSGGIETVFAGTAIGITVNSGGTEVVDGGATASGTTVNSGGIETVISGTAIGTTVNSGGLIDLPNLVYSGMQPVLSGDTLTVNEGGNISTLSLSGNYAGLTFGAAQDTGGGTLLTLAATPPCYVIGTRILTENGEVAVETLKVGDRTVLVDGHAAPIIWIGYRWVDCAHHPNPKQVWPVRVAEGAFGPRQPHRDLFLSPDHAVLVENVLIPIKHLINGATIEPVPVDVVTYYHVELDRHDVLLAEGLPAESYLDAGDRHKFSNGGGPISLFPDFSWRPPDSIAIWEAFGCAPLIVTGPKFDGVRMRLNARIAIKAAVPPWTGNQTIRAA